VDILPTILDYLGIPEPENCQGKSLRPVIEGKVEAVREFIFSEYTGGAVPDSYVLRSSRHKYYEGSGEQFAYDLAEDPNERHKILPDGFPEEVKLLQKKMRKLMAGDDRYGYVEP
jgi:arylsulfatase A-like enzyme